MTQKAYEKLLPKRTLEIRNNAAYINGDMYSIPMAIQVITHLSALGMIDNTTFSSWMNALTKGQ